MTAAADTATVGIAQWLPVPGEFERNEQTARAAVADLAAHGADLVVLPYREIDQSGVAFTALGGGVPMLLSDVGGFPELAAVGAARTFPAGDSAALRAVLEELLADPAALAEMADLARVAATGPYSWQAVARRTLDLYESLS